MNRFWIRYLPAFLREKLAGSATLQNVIGNTGWLFADNLLRMGVGLIVSVWVTRYLGPDQFGLLNYATAFVTLFSSIALLGLDGIIVRDFIRKPDRRDEIIGTAVALKFAGGLAMTAICILSIYLFRPDDYQSILLVCIISLGLVFQSFGTIEFWFQSQIQSKYCVIARSSAFLIIAAVKIGLILSKAPLTAFAWAGAAEIVIGSVALVAAYRYTGLRLGSLRVSRSVAMEMMRDSWPLIFADVVTVIYMRADKIILGETAGNHELGIYSVAILVAETLWLVPRALSASLYPGIVEAKGISDEVFHNKMQKYYCIMAFFTYVVALPVTLLGSWAVPFIFGPAYARAGTLLACLVWTGMFINLGLARSSYLTAMNWTRLHSVTDFLGCVVYLALNLVLIPRYGGMGAVIASFAAYWLAVHGSCYLFPPLRNTGRMLTRAMVYPKFW